MLYIKRTLGQGVMVGDVKIEVAKIGRSGITLSFSGSGNTKIVRLEILDEIIKQNRSSMFSDIPTS